MDGWLETFRATVFPWHCDHFGHLNARWYAAHFDDASYHLFQRLGMSYERMRETAAVFPVSARATIDYLHELRVGELIVIESGLVDLGNKSLKRRARMYNADTRVLCATELAVDVFFSEKTRKSTPIPDRIREALSPQLVSDEPNGRD